jgi:hypothetical protein
MANASAIKAGKSHFGSSFLGAFAGCLGLCFAMNVVEAQT